MEIDRLNCESGRRTNFRSIRAGTSFVPCRLSSALLIGWLAISIPGVPVMSIVGDQDHLGTGTAVKISCRFYDYRISSKDNQLHRSIDVNSFAGTGGSTFSAKMI